MAKKVTEETAEEVVVEDTQEEKVEEVKPTAAATKKATTVKTYAKLPEGIDLITDALKAVGESDVSLANRIKIARVNGIVDYKGTVAQHMEMINLLKEGKLVKA